MSGTDELADLSRTFNRTAESLEKRVEDMSAREQASRRFVADMSHELRTPLTAITAVTEVLEEELDAETGSVDPMIEPAVRLVVSETRRLNNLVENLMEVTRFDAGTARLVLDNVDIVDQITACIDARAWLDAVDLDAERGLMARVDPRRLDVIMANLIGNALKHGGSPVRVSVRDEGNDLVIEVQDHGPGIPEDVLPHVFDRFYKASASRPRSEGSGLGLSIALENAHIHGGEITAANSPKGGAVFTLRLPRDASELEDPDNPGSPGAATTTGRGARDVRTPRMGRTPDGRPTHRADADACGSSRARRAVARGDARRVRDPGHGGADRLRSRALPGAVHADRARHRYAVLARDPRPGLPALLLAAGCRWTGPCASPAGPAATDRRTGRTGAPGRARPSPRRTPRSRRTTRRTCRGA